MNSLTNYINEAQEYMKFNVPRFKIGDKVKVIVYNESWYKIHGKRYDGYEPNYDDMVEGKITNIKTAQELLDDTSLIKGKYAAHNRNEVEVEIEDNGNPDTVCYEIDGHWYWDYDYEAEKREILKA